MHVAERLSGYDRDHVLLIVDVRQVAVVRCVDVIRESGIAYPRHTVGDCAHARARWHMQREVDRVKQHEGCAEGVARDDDG